jgi:hypothetical protein
MRRTTKSVGCTRDQQIPQPPRDPNLEFVLFLWASKGGQNCTVLFMNFSSQAKALFSEDCGPDEFSFS